MSVITESEIRRRLKGKDVKEIKELKVLKGEIVTPSAKSFLSDNNIQLKYVDGEEELKEVEEEKVIIKENNYKFKTIYGGYLEDKPEHMTHLYGNVLVFKDHKRIILRGKIDSLESKILETQIICSKLGMTKIVNDLQEILDFVRNIIRCEVLNEKLEGFLLQGMTAEELRERSHNPQKYFGIGHFLPDHDMGEVVVALNSCRSLTRETELTAFSAFKNEYGDVEREDLIRGLNRLSSLFWIMMFKVRTGKYK
ncbi:cobalamin adenosyltransferase [Clostridium sp. MSJ-11]|uniref:Cobalamin adenosyltransferase n=1 Tax=Clostridium mobile TaxID=2841512 RepID=A0ABS6EDP9_9CLOT|nr:cobalamin adenosyltransferase [Clostridium mobile]MBU5483163.1 cobalamin adenosyltransferase [Clostridium mobile]